MTLRRESFNVCSSSLTSGASAQFASWVPARLSWLREVQGTSGEGGGLFLGWFCPASGSVSGWGLVFFSCTISVHVSVLSSGKFLLERAVSGD